MNFFDYLDCLVQAKQSAARRRTATNYISAGRALHRFLVHEGRERFLPFSGITPQLIQHFETYLLDECRLSRNSSSFYMRALHAVWNVAVRQGFTAEPDPFMNVYTSVDATTHRATSADTIRRLIAADLPAGSPLAFSRDLFVFSFLAYGMAFIDMAKMRKSDIDGGHLSYTRSKTTQHLRVQVTMAMQDIIERWSERTSPFLLPIVGRSFTQKAYDSALRRYNRHLKTLGQRLGIDDLLTSYTARHTWASEAYRLQIPVSVISSCMGHTTERTTRIYLKSFSSDYIDEQTATVERHFFGDEVSQDAVSNGNGWLISKPKYAFYSFASTASY